MGSCWCIRGFIDGSSLGSLNAIEISPCSPELHSVGSVTQVTSQGGITSALTPASSPDLLRDHSLRNQDKTGVFVFVVLAARTFLKVVTLFAFIHWRTLGGIWFITQGVWVLSCFCNLVDCVALQAPLSMGFSRQEYWSGLPCPPPRQLPNPGIEPLSVGSPAFAGRIFTVWATRLRIYTCIIWPVWGSPTRKPNPG